MALEFPDARVDASDLSSAALQVTRINIRKYRLSKRIRPVRSNLFEKLKTYDLIVSNPPYVTASSMNKLPKEYRREPRIALAAGSDGLELVHGILAQAERHLNPGGLLVCEIGGNRRALERAYPRLEFAWPEVSDPGTVFILRREQLPSAARTRRASGTPTSRARARR
jgi:ribosomal protein L3 glutamine methyltransferase